MGGQQGTGLICTLSHEVGLYNQDAGLQVPKNEANKPLKGPPPTPTPKL